MSTNTPRRVRPDAATIAQRAKLRAAVAAMSDYVGSWFDLQRRRKRCPGVQWAIGVDGEMLASGACGFADAVHGVPLTNEHLFRIASHSKWFAATLVMQLVEAGRLRLDDPVSTHLPTTAGTEVGSLSIRELLGHQAGVIRDGQDCNFWQLMRPFPDDAELLAMALAADDGLTYSTNEHFKYSNVGLGVIGLILEAVGGSSFAEQLAARIAGPLGLARTGGEWDEARRAEYARGHTRGLDSEYELALIPHVSTAAMAAATGCYSTAEDMVRFGSAHLLGDARLLSDRSKRLMQREESVIEVRGEEQGRYGLGVEIHRIGKRKLIGHSGGFPGFITRTFVDPADGLVVSVLTNALEGPAHELGVGAIKLIDMALELAEGAAAAPSTTEAEGAGDASVPRPSAVGFAGRFVNLWGYQDVVAVGERLVLLWPSADDPTMGRDDVTVLDEDRLRLAAQPGFGSAGEVIRYHRDEHGATTHIDIGGMTFWAPARFAAVRESILAERD